jgi:rhodanese-related sulfurtransferase
MKSLNQEQWSSLLKETPNAITLDVRTEIEVEEGKIPGALNLDIFNPQNFVSKLEHMDKSNHYFVYCKAGSRSAQACAVMQQMGFNHTYNLEGGFSNWTGQVEF